MNWGELLSEAYREALKSRDASTRIGALLVNEGGTVVARGHNSPTPGIAHDDPRLLLRPEKYLLTEHAERNAVYDAAARGVGVRGLTMVTPWNPCADCARGAIMSGVSRMVCHAEALHIPGWDSSRDIGLEMLEAAGVEIIMASCAPEVEGIFAGGVWHYPMTTIPLR